MKRIFLMYMITCIALSALGQKKGFLTKDVASKNFPFTLSDNVKTKNIFKYHYRFGRTMQVVDLWSDDDIVYHGSIITYIDKCDSHYKKNGILLEKKAVDDTKAAQIIETYKQLGIDKMPFMRDIPGWEPIKAADGLDIEYLLSGVYLSRSYWEPQEQTVAQGKTVNKFYVELKSILGLQDIARTFDAALPFGKYSSYGFPLKKTTKRLERNGYYLYN